MIYQNIYPKPTEINLKETKHRIKYQTEKQRRLKLTQISHDLTKFWKKPQHQHPILGRRSLGPPSTRADVPPVGHSCHPAPTPCSDPRPPPPPSQPLTLTIAWPPPQPPWLCYLPSLTLPSSAVTPVMQQPCYSA